MDRRRWEEANVPGIQQPEAGGLAPVAGMGTMSGKKADKQPGNRQGRAGQKASRKQKGRAARGKARPASSSKQEASPYQRGSPQEASDGMPEQGHRGKGSARLGGAGKQYWQRGEDGLGASL